MHDKPGISTLLTAKIDQLYSNIQMMSQVYTAVD